MDITYGTVKLEKTPKLFNKSQLELTKKYPIIKISEPTRVKSSRLNYCDIINKYSIIIYDVISSANIQSRIFIHLWISNIEIINNVITKSDTWIDYYPPIPPPKSGTHRYYYSLYRQNKSIRNTVNRNREFTSQNFKNSILSFGLLEVSTKSFVYIS